MLGNWSTPRFSSSQRGRSNRPGKFLFVVFSVATTIISLGLQPYINEGALRELQTFLTHEEIRAAFQGTRTAYLVGMILIPVSLLSKWGFYSVLAWLIGSLLAIWREIRKIFSILVWSSISIVFESLYVLLILWMRGIETISSYIDLQVPIGSNVLFSQTSPPLYSLLGHFNLFEIWFVQSVLLGHFNLFEIWFVSLVAIGIAPTHLMFFEEGLRHRGLYLGCWGAHAVLDSILFGEMSSNAVLRFAGSGRSADQQLDPVQEVDKSLCKKEMWTIFWIDCIKGANPSPFSPGSSRFNTFSCPRQPSHPSAPVQMRTGSLHALLVAEQPLCSSPRMRRRFAYTASCPCRSPRQRRFPRLGSLT